MSKPNPDPEAQRTEVEKADGCSPSQRDSLVSAWLPTLMYLSLVSWDLWSKLLLSWWDTWTFFSVRKATASVMSPSLACSNRGSFTEHTHQSGRQRVSELLRTGPTIRPETKATEQERAAASRALQVPPPQVRVQVKLRFEDQRRLMLLELLQPPEMVDQQDQKP